MIFQNQINILGLSRPGKKIRRSANGQETVGIKGGGWLRLAATSTDEGDKLGGTMKLRSNTIQAKPVTNKPAR